MLKLYGIDLSPPVNKVRFVLNALQLEYDYQRVNFAGGENQTETYLALHPAGKVPVLVDDDLTLFESDAIIRYLAKCHENTFYLPANEKQQALIDQWMAFTSNHIGSAFGHVLFNKRICKLIGTPGNEALLEHGLLMLERFLPVVDQQLSGHRFLCGNQLTLADFVLLANLDPAEVCQVDLKPYAHLMFWRQQLKQESFYQTCFSDYSILFD